MNKKQAIEFLEGVSGKLFKYGEVKVTPESFVAFQNAIKSLKEKDKK